MTDATVCATQWNDRGESKTNNKLEARRDYIQKHWDDDINQENYEYNT